MENLIREKLIKYYETCSVDGYGQVGVIRFHEVFDKSLMDSILKQVMLLTKVFSLCNRIAHTEE